MRKTAFFIAFVWLLAFSHSILGEDCGYHRVSNDRAMLGVGTSHESEGLRVDSIVPGGPAEAAGLQIGDLIVEINGDALLFPDRAAAIRWLNRYRAGQDLSLSVDRGGATEALKMRGSRITCEAAKRLDSILRAAEEGSPVACAGSEDSPEDRANADSRDQVINLLHRLPNQGVAITVTAGPNGTSSAIATDVPLQGPPLELHSLPNFMQELVERLNEGESITFQAKPESTDGRTGRGAKVEIVAFPDRFLDFWQ